MARDASGHRIFSSYITERKKLEFEARKRVEDRGGVLITTSTSVAALIFTLSAFLTGKDKDAAVFSDAAAALFLVGSLGAFVVAAVIGIYVQSKPLKYNAADEETLLSFPEKQDRWAGSESWAARLCAWIDIDGIISLQSGTRLKAIWLTVGLYVQSLALGLLVISLALELISRNII